MTEGEKAYFSWKALYDGLNQQAHREPTCVPVDSWCAALEYAVGQCEEVRNQFSRERELDTTAVMAFAHLSGVRAADQCIARIAPKEEEKGKDK